VARESINGLYLVGPPKGKPRIQEGKAGRTEFELIVSGFERF